MEAILAIKGTVMILLLTLIVTCGLLTFLVLKGRSKEEENLQKKKEELKELLINRIGMDEEEAQRIVDEMNMDYMDKALKNLRKEKV